MCAGLQAAASPAGMGAILPFGGDTDEEEEEPGVKLEGRMGYAGSSPSMDDDTSGTHSLEEASTLLAGLTTAPDLAHILVLY